MSAHQSEAVTLRTYPYAETHKVAVFLTRQFGKLRAMAYGAKSGRRNRYGSSLEPMTHVRLTFARREHQELSTVQQCEIIRAYPDYSLNFEINLHVSYFAELLVEFSSEEEESENLFRLALAVMDALGKAPPATVARYFELWLLRLEGVLPDLARKLPAPMAEAAGAMLRLHPTQLTADTLTQPQGKRLESLAEELIEYHLEKRLKSRKMLKELL